MPSATPDYEIYALRYAHAPKSAIRTFLLPPPNAHDQPVPMDFYVWAIRSDKHTIVVDTGFKAEVGRRRRPEWKVLQSPDAALQRIGIDAAETRDVVISHLDWDHSGNTAMFPKAMLHIQDAEVAFRTGRHMTHPFFAQRAEIDDVLTTVRDVYAGRVRFHDGTGEIAPGVTLHLVGGHTAGMQVVRVPTARGWVVLASDAAHYWANLRQRHPFPIVLDVGKMLEGFRLMEQLADGPDHIIPGHDPEVLQRFPAVSGDPDIVRLDRKPG
jgi:glyoxylase-like metal-dependent hydrolase (beta-lactamase superfamily II)